MTNCRRRSSLTSRTAVASRVLHAITLNLTLTLTLTHSLTVTLTPTLTPPLARTPALALSQVLQAACTGSKDAVAPLVAVIAGGLLNLVGRYRGDVREI